MYKIILDCDLMRYRDSGLYHYCLNLSAAMSKMMGPETERKFSCYIPSDVKNVFNDENECIIEKKWHHKLAKPFLWDCNIWHAPFQSGRIIVPQGNKRVKIVLTIHDLNCLHEDKTKKEREESLTKTQKLIDRSDAIVCISNHCKTDVVNNLELNNKPVYVIHNGTHQLSVPPLKPTGYHPAKPFIFTMGYVNRKKNFHTLLPLLLNNEIDLIIAGKLDEPDYVNTMKWQASNMGIADNLHILGPVSEDDKAWYLKNCLAFALPSLAEGFGAPVVEAMQFGKPLFLSALTSLPEIGGEAAFYFKNFEPASMQEIFKKGLIQYKQNGLVNKIIERGNEFSWKEKAQEYLTVYDTLL